MPLLHSTVYTGRHGGGGEALRSEEVAAGLSSPEPEELYSRCGNRIFCRFAYMDWLGPNTMDPVPATIRKRLTSCPVSASSRDGPLFTAPLLVPSQIMASDSEYGCWSLILCSLYRIREDDLDEVLSHLHAHHRQPSLHQITSSLVPGLGSVTPGWPAGGSGVLEPSSAVIACRQR